jgi:hypothetical protein
LLYTQVPCDCNQPGGSLCPFITRGTTNEEILKPYSARNAYFLLV